MPTLYILDVKHGNSSVLFDNGTVIIDAGNNRYLFDFLEQHKVEKVDAMLLSHADADHIGGLKRIIEEGSIKVAAIYFNADTKKDSDLWFDLVYSIQEYNDSNDNPIYTSPLTTDSKVQLTQGQVNLEILAPKPAFIATGKNYKKEKANSNSISAVIRLVYQNQPIALLPADIDQIGLDNLLKYQIDIQAWLLIFPHHGGKAGKDINIFTHQICHAVQPEHIIFSIGKNKDKFPLKDVIETIQKEVPSTCMYTTNFSEIFQDIIQQSDKHKNCTGSIHIDFSQQPLILNFIK